VSDPPTRCRVPARNQYQLSTSVGVPEPTCPYRELIEQQIRPCRHCLHRSDSTRSSSTRRPIPLTLRPHSRLFSWPRRLQRRRLPSVRIRLRAMSGEVTSRPVRASPRSRGPGWNLESPATPRTTCSHAGSASMVMGHKPSSRPESRPTARTARRNTVRGTKCLRPADLLERSGQCRRSLHRHGRGGHRQGSYTRTDGHSLGDIYIDDQ
jgi:hypothetical protein